MKKLQTKLFTSWKEKNMVFILKFYKDAPEFHKDVIAAFDA